jgi:hypothetical protein
VDVCFLFDIAVILNTAYYDAHFQLVTDRGMVFRNYLTGMLLVDVITIFPFYALDIGRQNRFFKVLRLARLIKIFRATKFVGISRTFRASSRVNMVIRFCKFNKGLVRLLTFGFVVLILSHFAACLWYYTARLDEFGHDTWVVRYGMMDEPQERLYLASLYWALTTLTTVGYGDIAARTTVEMSFSLIWMLFGVGIYSFVIGSLTSVLSNYDARQIVINRRIKMFEVYGREHDIPHSVLSGIYSYLSSNQEITVLDEYDKKQLLLSVPKKYRL